MLSCFVGPPQLKNENNLLPLSTTQVKTLAVIGWGANDTYAPLVTHPSRLCCSRTYHRC